VADTSSLRAQADSKSAQKDQKEREKKEIDEKIERLRTAKSQMTAEKNVVKELRSAVKKQEKPDNVWRGQKRNQDAKNIDI
jgi:hypothetical protein